MRQTRCKAAPWGARCLSVGSPAGRGTSCLKASSLPLIPPEVGEGLTEVLSSYPAAKYKLSYRDDPEDKATESRQGHCAGTCWEASPSYQARLCFNKKTKPTPCGMFLSNVSENFKVFYFTLGHLFIAIDQSSELQIVRDLLSDFIWKTLNK